MGISSRNACLVIVSLAFLAVLAGAARPVADVPKLAEEAPAARREEGQPAPAPLADKAPAAAPAAEATAAAAEARDSGDGAEAEGGDAAEEGEEEAPAPAGGAPGAAADKDAAPAPEAAAKEAGPGAAAAADGDGGDGADSEADGGGGDDDDDDDNDDADEDADDDAEERRKASASPLEMRNGQYGNGASLQSDAGPDLSVDPTERQARFRTRREGEPDADGGADAGADAENDAAAEQAGAAAAARLNAAAAPDVMLITGARPTAGEGAKTHARERHRSGVRSRQEQRKRNAAFIGYQEFTGPLHNIVLVTKHGSITIAPRSDISPITVAKVMSLAAHPKQQHGEVTRHEPVAPRWGTKGFGPPYALISGVFHSADEESPLEGNPIVLKGDVAMVPGTMTFVIALAEHPEWGNSHTVWGKVDVMDAESWGTLHKMPKEPYANRTDNGVTTRWLEPEAVTPFHVRLKPIVARQEVELAGSLMGLSAAGRQEA